LSTKESQETSLEYPYR